MTIRKRLTFAFSLIILLFAVNLSIYFWGNQQRQTSVEALRRAVSSQAAISAINQSLNDIQKQVTLLSQVATETPAGAAEPGEALKFNQQLQSIEQQIAELRDLAEPGNRNNIDSFSQAFQKLGASWRVFYQNFGIDQTKAITELAVRAEPLSQDLLQIHLPQLQKDENGRVESASANFYRTAALADRITIAIFAISAAVAIGVAFVVSRQLTLGLKNLKQGATSIGSGQLDQRIDLRSNDELSDLAAAFNEMTAKLSATRDLLTRAHALEQRKGEELEKAMGQLRNTQDQLVVQQKLASLGSLTAGIAHEIKNPLNFVTNFAEISGTLVAELKECLYNQRENIAARDLEEIDDILNGLLQNVGKIREHGKRADGIVRNMLMHSRGQSGDRQEVNLNSLVSEYVKLAYHGMRAQNQSFNVGIREEYDPAVGTVRVVAHDLCRVFLNIANNACYSAFEKRKRLGDGFAPFVMAKTRDLGSSVEVRIRDNGDGITEAAKTRIFEPFFTTKPAGSGTGLGLSMSFDIVVQQHKGELRMESEAGQFAEFIITLPRSI